jgi:hypothetical protein
MAVVMYPDFIGKTESVPVGVMRPMNPGNLVNQRLPSDPAVIPQAKLIPGLVGAEESGNSVIWPLGVIRPM